MNESNNETNEYPALTLPRTKLKTTIIESSTNIVEITNDIFNDGSENIITNILATDDNNYNQDQKLNFKHDQTSNSISQFEETHLLNFENLPKGDPMRLPEFHLNGDRSLFIYLSQLLSYLEPNEYPIGK